MEIGIGAGIAICGTSFGIAAIVMKWISASTADRQCQSHAMIAQQIRNVELWLDKVEKKLDRVIEKL